MSKTLLIIDGFALVFRAFYALPPNMTLPNGEPINAVYGLVTQLLKAIDQVKPDYVCVCLDRKEPTFRDELYPDYKANRPDPPEDLVSQFPLIRPTLEGMGVPILDAVGFEADDMIGSLSKLASANQIDSKIVTGDMDILQLVDERINVLMPDRKSGGFAVMDASAVTEKYSITPDQIIDYKALKGDTSDNIPGVRGIGDKTAVKLLSEYQTLDGIYEHIEDITSKSVKQKLTDGREMADVSKQLATIKVDVPIEAPVESYLYQHDTDKLVAQFQEMGFNSLVKRYATTVVPTPVSADKEIDGTYDTILSQSALKKLIPTLTDGFAIDLETTSLSEMEAQIIGVAISTAPKTGVYIPLNQYVKTVAKEQSVPLFSIDEPTTITFECNPFLTLLKPILEDPAIPKVLHNAKYDTSVLKNYGISMQGVSFDTLIAAFLCYPGSKIGLKDLVATHFGIQMIAYDEVVGAHDGQFELADIKDATLYAAADADMTLRLRDFLAPKLAEHNMTTLFETIEMPLVEILGNMERAGVCLDQSYLGELSTQFSAEIAQLTADIYKLAGGQFNINSTKQLGELLFDQLGLPVIKKTKTGRSTDASVLEKLEDQHEIIPKLLRYRSLEKLMSTYVTALPVLISPQTGRIHTSFNQTVALTGRLSSTSPNLQNIPIRTDDGLKIRRAFLPLKPGHKILSADYSQIELRVMAHLCEDPQLIAAYQSGQDIHTQTAAVVFHVPAEQVTKDQRYFAKSVNFGIIYGQSAFGLAKQLKIPQKEAKQIIESYFETFPAIREFIDGTIAEAKETGYVVTEFGRMRWLPDITAKNGSLRQYAERIAVNTRVQGTAADIMKKAMIAIDKQMRDKQVRSTMLIQVHDELVFDVHPEETALMMSLVSEQMSQAVSLVVPLEVDAVMGDNWLEIS